VHLQKKGAPDAPSIKNWPPVIRKMAKIVFFGKPFTNLSVIN
jgi:hypothetical protein